MDFSKPIQIDLPISHAGAFKYWVEYDDDDGNRVQGPEGYFNVDPVLRVRKRAPIISPEGSVLPVLSGGGAIGTDDVELPLDGLVVLTVVSKWMGTADEWRPHFEEARDRGYNMLHYTPLQQRGESRSPYSLADQLLYDSELFEAGWKATPEEKAAKMKEVLGVARSEYGLLGLIDVVLNHTANNSPWLLDHPEAGSSFFNIKYMHILRFISCSRLQSV